MDIILTSAAYGTLGGLFRAFVGIMKYSQKNKQEKKYNLTYLLSSLLVSTVVGAVAGALTENDWKLSFVAGYAGIDFIESLYKIRYQGGFEI